ncbi:MAG: Leucine-rich repeat (LRR) protein [Alteromonas naphthalenivorans]|jgi:Leucine-rich repeat (LRR) protein
MKKITMLLLCTVLGTMQAKNFEFTTNRLQSFVSGSGNQKILEITHRKIKNLPDDLSKLLKPIVDKKTEPVRIIDFSHNHIKELKKHTFNDITKVEFIKLTHNKIKHIYPHAFDSLQSLQWIYLSHNNIRDLRDDTFKHLTGVWGIMLDHNDIRTLKEDVLDDLRLLHHISFAHNKIKRLQGNMFADIRTEKDDANRKVSNLEVIDFSHNPIEKVEENAFADLPNLKTLIISQDLPADIIQTIKAQAYNANKTCEVVLV